MSIEGRMAKLERTCRWWRCWTVGLALVAVVACTESVNRGFAQVGSAGPEYVQTQEKPISLGTMADITLYGSDGKVIKQVRAQDVMGVKMLPNGAVTWYGPRPGNVLHTMIGTMVIESR